MRKKTRRLALFLAAILTAGSAGCSPETFYRELEKFTDHSRAVQKETSGEENGSIKGSPVVPETAKEEFYYGYSVLGEEEQKIYEKLASGIENFQEEISVEAASKEALERAMKMVVVDHPEYFWTDGTSSYSYQELPGGKIQNMKVRPEYQTDRITAEKEREQIEAKIREWLEGVPQGADEYEQIKYVYETLIRQVSYDPGVASNQNIKSVFLEGGTVCMGYAKAAQYLLNRLGIFCTLVTGSVTKEEGGREVSSSHAWNLVRVGEEYYYMDVTWGNPGYMNPGAKDLYISYSYLCCDWKTLEHTHKPDGEIPLPSCTDDSYNYYKRNGSWYEVFDREEISGALVRDLEEQKPITELRFGSQEAYDQAEEALVRGKLTEEAVRASSVLKAGKTYSWQTYYGGSDWLIVISWDSAE